MSVSPNSPRLLKGAILLVDAASGTRLRTIVLQYNPDTLTRTLQVQGAGESGDRSEVLRLTGAPAETIQIEVEVDAADYLEDPASHPLVAERGIHPQLAALECLIYPTTEQSISVRSRASEGMLEILPAEAPLQLFVWGAGRVVPIRITEFRVTEEAFDPNLNPLRARVSLGMRVLNENDLGFAHRGSGIFRTYHQRKERLAEQVRYVGLNVPEIDGV